MIPIEHHQLSANGATFHVASAGTHNDHAIFFLHGFPEGWMSWRAVMQQLSGRYAVYAPDLRGYPSAEMNGEPARSGFEIFNLMADVRALISALGVHRPLLVGHDWGGALAWCFAHQHSELLRGLAVVNCTHPKTLARAILHCQDWQALRVPWLPVFQIPRLPEWALTTATGRRLLRWSFTAREGYAGHMDMPLVDELVERFRRPADMAGPIDYYRAIVATHLVRRRRTDLLALYDRAIGVPVSLIWGMEDKALSWRVARRSAQDAGCAVDWRPLPGIGHFVNLEAVDALTAELERAARPIENG